MDVAIDSESERRDRAKLASQGPTSVSEKPPPSGGWQRLYAPINKPLMKQAVINLFMVDIYIKFTWEDPIKSSG